MLSRDKVLQRFMASLEQLADAGKAELFKQGHVATGKGIQSIGAEITNADLQRLVGVILANDYLIPQDTGVPASRIPFSPGSGAPPSKYIQGLINWAQVVRPGLNMREAKSFAFAVAYTHLREGMPSNGSYNFSSNGRRTEWIKFGLDQNASQVEEDLRLFELVADSFDEAIREAARA